MRERALSIAPFVLVALVVFLPLIALADDVVVTPSAGDAFVVTNNTGATERLRIDEATGDISRNGILFLHTSANSTFIGIEAGSAGIGSADGNTALGSYALHQTSSGGANNVAVGAGALETATSAAGNTAVGSGALGSTINGSNNVAVGRAALFEMQAGSSNVAIGNGTMSGLGLTGSHNVAIGAALAVLSGSSTDNVGVGTQALANLGSGSSNAAIGLDAGSGLTSGSNNVYVSAPSGGAVENGRIRIGAPGVHSETWIAGISGNLVNAGATTVFVDSSGQLGTSIASSQRFKQEIETLDADGRVQRLRPVTFRYREEMGGGADSPLEYGLIAEEVAAVAPELAIFDDDGKPVSVRYPVLTPLLVAEVQRQQRVIDEQAAQLRMQGSRLRTLIERVDALERAGAAK